jgi:hypothetical protein
VSEIKLEQDQRDVLLDVIKRRLDGLNDKALMEMERLTRKPQELVYFAPIKEKKVMIKHQPSPLIIQESPKGIMSRRRLLMSLGALAAVGGIGGVYMLGSETRQNSERYAQLNAIVQATIDSLHSDMMEVFDDALEIADRAYVLRGITTNFIDCYPGMRSSLERWWIDTSLMKQDYQAMQLVEGGVKVIAEVLSTLAGSIHITKIVNIIKPRLRSQVKLDADALRVALQALSDLLTHLDPALHAADVAHLYLTPWFSGSTESDIKHRLLDPLEDEFSPRVISLGEQCEELRSDWEQKFIQSVNALQQQG